MNPPFGQATPAAASYIEKVYPETRLDLFAVFCERLLALAHPDGLVGAITPRDGFFKKTLGGWRDLMLANRPTVVADLGIGVLDAATVRVAAYVIARTIPDAPSRFIDVVDVPDRDTQLRSEIDSPKRTFNIAVTRFEKLPLKRFLYWLPARLWEIFDVAPAIENLACTPRYGLTTLDDDRFCRLFFEVRPELIGAANSWAFMSKGGDDFPFGGVSNSVVLWQDNAAEMAEVNRRANGQVAQTRRASKYYFRPAISFSNRSVQFSARWHPGNYVFSVRGPVVIPLSASSAYLMGFFNSRLIRALVQMQTASQTYTSGVLKELRWVEPDVGTRRDIEKIAETAFTACRVRLATIETDPCFSGIVPHSLNATIGTWDDYVEWRLSAVEYLNKLLADCQIQLDEHVAKLYGVSTSDIERCERAEGEDVEPTPFPPTFRFSNEPGEALASFLFGVAVGRWQAAPVAFAPTLESRVPNRQPALGGGPVRLVLVDDEGHPDDIVRAVSAALREVLPGTTDNDELRVGQALGSGSLRDWYSRVFFGRHLVTYSGFGRKAPIYWQLATPSLSYSVWLYIHAFNNDSIFRIQNDYVAPKLAHEERRLQALDGELRGGATSAQRKALTAQVALVEELRVFLDEVKRVAPLWRPNLDDGVIINFAPIWRLVPQNKAWQSELKATWDALCDGQYDWAHLAMHLWPERVIPKCAEDCSLAIAHGLETVFWVQGADGKWTARTAPTRSVEELVKERTSAAVKSALKNLLEAPVVNGKSARRKTAPVETGDV
jgi:hypothetical protein